MERDRQAVVELAQGKVIGELLGVLDDIGRARDHGELTGGFRRVGESLEAALAKMGLDLRREGRRRSTRPARGADAQVLRGRHRADRVAAILQPGYRIGERILRVARVAVAEPEDTE